MKKLLKYIPTRIQCVHAWENNYVMGWIIRVTFRYRQTAEQDIIEMAAKKDKAMNKILRMIQQMDVEDEMTYYVILNMIENFYKLFKNQEDEKFLKKELNARMTT